MEHSNFFSKLLWDRSALGSVPVKLYNAAKNNRYLLQRMVLEKSLDVHGGCVNTICWNSTGKYLLSGSDDLHLCVTDAFTGHIKASIRTGHATNIFSAKYLPNTGDTQAISCSGDGVIIYTDLNVPETSRKNIFDCQEESVYDIATVPNDSNSFLTCSHDHTVRWYDLRVKSSCKHPSFSRFARRQHKCNDDVLIRCDYPVTAISVNSLMPCQLAIGCSDSIIRVYDRRMLSTKSLGGFSADADSSVLAKFTYSGVKGNNRITSLAYSRNCQQLLASYSNDFLYLFNINDVRNTINASAEEDIIPDKNDKTPSCAFKRFRLRGDWSDTGPNAQTTDEMRASGSSTHLTATMSTSAMRGSQSAGPTSSSQATTVNSGNATSGSALASSSGNSQETSRSGDARIRHLNTILSLILRSSYRGSNESLHSENNNLPYEEGLPPGPAASSARGHSLGDVSSEGVINSAARDPRVPPLFGSSSSTSLQPNASHSASGSTDASANNSPNSFLIQFIGDEAEYPQATRRYGENGAAAVDDGPADDDDDDFRDEEEEIDSDTTSDSVFNHPDEASSLLSGGNASGRQRSRSSSSPDSSRRVRRRTRSTRGLSSRNRLIYEALQKTKRETVQEVEECLERAKRLKTYKIRNYKTFSGHRNSRTVIKEATFWGDDYIVSGSDCGHIFFWSIEDQKLAMYLEGDHHVVNCLQPHPTDPILASSGIDYDIKIWSPRSEDNKFDERKAKKIVDRNKLMMEESRDTVTVPARFVLSLFSTLRNRHQADRDRENEARQAPNAPNEDAWNEANLEDVNMDDDDDDDDEVEL